MHETRAKFCFHCGATLPEAASYCPSCGSKISQRKRADHPTSAAIVAESLVEAPRSRPRLDTRARILGLAFLAALIVVICLFGIARVQKEMRADSAAKAAYEDLAIKLKSLRLVQSSINSMAGKSEKEYSLLQSDFRAAYQSGQWLHDNTEGDYSPSRARDVARAGLHSLAGAQAAEDKLETVDSAIVSGYNTLYGEHATHEFQADLASMHEARNNAITDWRNAMDSISDDMISYLNKGTFPYSDVEIAAHYTEANRDWNDAVKNSKLAEGSAQLLRARLNKDIEDVRSRMRVLRS